MISPNALEIGSCRYAENKSLSHGESVCMGYIGVSVRLVKDQFGRFEFVILSRLCGQLACIRVLIGRQPSLEAAPLAVAYMGRTRGWVCFLFSLLQIVRGVADVLMSNSSPMINGTRSVVSSRRRKVLWLEVGDVCLCRWRDFWRVVGQPEGDGWEFKGRGVAMPHWKRTPITLSNANSPKSHGQY